MSALKIFFISVFFLNFKIFFLVAYDTEAMDKALNFEVDLIYENLCYAPLNNMYLCNRLFSCASLIGTDFRNSQIRNSGFCGADMRKAVLRKSDLEKSDLRNVNLCNADLTEADLTGANFTNSKMRGVKLDGAIVADANFKGAKGLTNEQKKYLRDHGAINVPIDMEYALDEKSKEVSHEIKQRTLKERLLRPFVRRWKWYFGSKNASTQTT